MKIGNPADKPGSAAPVAPVRNQPAETKAAEAGAHKGAATDPSAKVELSNTASSLLEGGASADFDADKVARIAQAISDGKFEINAEKIADRLIANAHEVLGKAQH
ncbi:MAG: flagellar biosynthesis anti-sigma factor FlgM [Rhizobacter sp.]|nr:flagellar biosynthesis anti-sigma factor FlgM [Rhizobacter sp.]